jgi:hypothetical protein
MFNFSSPRILDFFSRRCGTLAADCCGADFLQEMRVTGRGEILRVILIVEEEWEWASRY